MSNSTPSSKPLAPIALTFQVQDLLQRLLVRVLQRDLEQDPDDLVPVQSHLLPVQAQLLRLHAGRHSKLHLLQVQSLRRDVDQLILQVDYRELIIYPTNTLRCQSPSNSATRKADMP